MRLTASCLIGAAVFATTATADELYTDLTGLDDTGDELYAPAMLASTMASSAPIPLSASPPTGAASLCTSGTAVFMPQTVTATDGIVHASCTGLPGYGGDQGPYSYMNSTDTEAMIELADMLEEAIEPVVAASLVIDDPLVVTAYIASENGTSSTSAIPTTRTSSKSHEGTPKPDTKSTGVSGTSSITTTSRSTHEKITSSTSSTVRPSSSITTARPTHEEATSSTTGTAHPVSSNKTATSAAVSSTAAGNLLGAEVAMQLMGLGAVFAML